MKGFLSFVSIAFWTQSGGSTLRSEIWKNAQLAVAVIRMQFVARVEMQSIKQTSTYNFATSTFAKEKQLILLRIFKKS